MKLQMEYQNENGIAFISGIVGTLLLKIVAGLNFDWLTIWDALGDLAWVGIVAAFSGAMGVLGKYYINKLIKLFTKNKKS